MIIKYCSKLFAIGADIDSVQHSLKYVLTAIKFIVISFLENLKQKFKIFMKYKGIELVMMCLELGPFQILYVLLFCPSNTILEGKF